MKRTRQERFRLAVLYALVCTFFLVAVMRLSYLQVWMHPQYSRIVQEQTRGRISMPAERGLIYDRNGTIVAENVSVASLYAYPLNDREVHGIGRYLEQVFRLKRGSARKKFGLAPERFRWIKRQLDDELAQAIEENAPGGLYLRKEACRLYPFGSVGKQVLGFTDIDQNGLAGVELSFDSVLAGRKGVADIRRDGLRNTFRVREAALVKPISGKSLVLTIDWPFQEIVEQELRNGVERYHAKSGMAIFLDCHNGDMLAACCVDPGDKSTDKPNKLRPVTDQFEPGSVLKAFTAAALLEAEILDCDDSIYCEDGKWKVGHRILHDDKKHGWLSFADVFHLSSNIGIAKCAIELGGDQLYETLRRFAFGRMVGVDLPGEAEGQLVRPRRWSDYTIAALAMGHSVAVTPLQLAVGFSAIANGGELLQPRVERGLVEGGKLTGWETDPISRGRVMKREWADTLKLLLRGVVEHGTGELVNSPVISIAGKTGTAEVPDLKNGGYIKNKFMASFAGFFPCEEPQIVGVVVLQEPEPVHYGGYTAGPIFRRIAERYVVRRPDLFEIESSLLAQQSHGSVRTVEVPDLVGRDLALARTIVEDRELQLHTGSDKGNVVWQYPPADRLLLAGDEVLAAVQPQGRQAGFMADLTGLSLRQAAALLQSAGVKFRVKGNGRIVKQSIRPGAEISDQTICRLECRPL